MPGPYPGAGCPSEPAHVSPRSDVPSAIWTGPINADRGVCNNFVSAARNAFDSAGTYVSEIYTSIVLATSNTGTSLGADRATNSSSAIRTSSGNNGPVSTAQAGQRSTQPAGVIASMTSERASIIA